MNFAFESGRDTEVTHWSNFDFLHVLGVVSIIQTVAEHVAKVFECALNPICHCFLLGLLCQFTETFDLYLLQSCRLPSNILRMSISYVLVKASVLQCDTNDGSYSHKASILRIDIELALAWLATRLTKSVCSLMIEEDQPLNPNTSLARLTTASQHAPVFPHPSSPQYS